jgi:hypothetical protein
VRLAHLQSAARDSRPRTIEPKQQQQQQQEKIDMKMSQLVVAVAVAGLLGMSARASLPDGYSSAKVKLTLLMQAASTTTSSSIKFNTMKVKVTNKEILNLIASQWDVSLGDGSQLVLDNFYDGQFSVLNKDGAVIIGDASEYGDTYWALWTGVQYNYGSDTDASVYTGKGTETSISYKYDAIGYFYWVDADDYNNFEIYGEATINDSGKAPSTSKEKFKLTGADYGQWDGDNAVVTGTISGSGKNNVYF